MYDIVTFNVIPVDDGYYMHDIALTKVQNREVQKWRRCDIYWDTSYLVQDMKNKIYKL